MINLAKMIKKVIYQGEEYNITPFINHHPGGAAIIDHYLTLKKDITDVFKSSNINLDQCIPKKHNINF